MADMLLPGLWTQEICANMEIQKQKGKQMESLTASEQIDQKHQEDLQRLRGFRLLDDDFLTKCFEGDTPVGKLMHDFSCTDAADMYYGTLADRGRFFKESKEGIEIMCRAMEDMRNQTLREQSILQKECWQMEY